MELNSSRISLDGNAGNTATASTSGKASPQAGGQFAATMQKQLAPDNSPPAQDDSHGKSDGNQAAASGKALPQAAARGAESDSSPSATKHKPGSAQRAADKGSEKSALAGKSDQDSLSDQEDSIDGLSEMAKKVHALVSQQHQASTRIESSEDNMTNSGQLPAELTFTVAATDADQPLNTDQLTAEAKLDPESLNQPDNKAVPATPASNTTVAIIPPGGQAVPANTMNSKAGTTDIKQTTISTKAAFDNTATDSSVQSAAQHPQDEALAQSKGNSADAKFMAINAAENPELRATQLLTNGQHPGKAAANSNNISKTGFGYGAANGALDQDVTGTPIKEESALDSSIFDVIQEGLDSGTTLELAELPVNDPELATPDDGGDHPAILTTPLTSTVQTLAQPLTSTTAAQVQMYSAYAMGTEAWLKDMGTRLAWMDNEGIQSAELQLHPAELGAMEITITMQDDRAVVKMVAASAQTRELLEATLPRLREILANSGLQLDQGSVFQGKGNQEQSAQRRTSPNTPQEDPLITPNAVTRASVSMHQIDHYV